MQIRYRTVQTNKRVLRVTVNVVNIGVGGFWGVTKIYKNIRYEDHTQMYGTKAYILVVWAAKFLDLPYIITVHYVLNITVLPDTLIYCALWFMIVRNILNSILSTNYTVRYRTQGSIITILTRWWAWITHEGISIMIIILSTFF